MIIIDFNGLFTYTPAVIRVGKTTDYVHIRHLHYLPQGTEQAEADNIGDVVCPLHNLAQHLCYILWTQGKHFAGRRRENTHQNKYICDIVVFFHINSSLHAN